MVSLLLASTGSLTGFNLLLSAVPLYVAPGTGAIGAGLTTGAMMLSTVLIELVVPRLTARLGYRAVFGLGIVLLAAPTAVLTTSANLAVVVAVCFARGMGLGILVVTGTAVVAASVPSARRSEGLGLYGVAVGVPPVIGLPAGVWLIDRIGFDALFLLATALPLAVLPLALGLPSQRTRAARHEPVLAALRTGGLARPTAIFFVVTFAAGVFVTFLALAVPAESRGTAAAALLAQSAVTPAARWVAGRVGDRRGSGVLLVPAVLACAGGAAGTAFTGSPAVVVAGMVVFGIGFGVAQNVTLALLFDRVPRSGFDQVSALWNLAYDAGMGVGAVGFGAVAGATGYAMGLAGVALLFAVALVPAIVDRREGKQVWTTGSNSR
ncbi:hypothetical protein HUW46_06463 [Amycolatopsis sp. CA-230715]|nr:hypothetical protein HUW46_06463 [Amycolatopsis sp. CA-230715]